MVSRWGRGGLPLLEASAGVRQASRAFRCAFVALALVAITLVAFIALRPQKASGGNDLASLGLGLVYFAIAPLLLIAGISFGLSGLRNGSDNRGRSIAAIGLNILLLIVGGMVAVVSVYLA